MVGSLVAFKRVVGVNDHKLLTNTVCRLASAALITDRAYFGGVERMLKDSSLDLVLYVEFASYDETSMDTKGSEILYQSSSKGCGQVAGSTPPSAGAVATINRKVIVSDTGPSKLFQTRSCLAMVVRRRSPEPDQADEYFHFVGSPLAMVQVIDNSTSEVLQESLRRAACVPKDACAFELTVRAATGDKLSANLKAEKSLLQSRGPTWLPLHNPCDIHAASGSMTKTLSLTKGQANHMVQLSLSLRLRGNMKRFRSCLQAVISSKLQLKMGESSREARGYRNDCLQLFLSRGSFAARRQMQL